MDVALAVAPEFTDGDYVDALNGGTAEVVDGKLKFTLPGQTAAFITRKP